ncbi:CgeB family protein [Phaeodactylibacter xiamenensis]|uniref:Spore protein YkvP/CgeB glycosyl transferase-like domain-containing protein n=1 Tax=Phaeodactylibacter xiamenensis TaxID=1524460 RepID=A0A098S393_9BACT|nr:glycosyltransferase [Phaeodactylibacter xiamenensis]KGE86610.1 hypothetical protein IX84_20155 [Phaeodactylibacter xiamenensis]
MKVLYIGQYTEGTTSKMRAEALRRITAPVSFEYIDTHVPFYRCHPIWRSLAFRFKKGKVIGATNTYILEQLSGHYDVIWVDKAVFITKKVTQQLSKSSELLVHYTPDTAFKENVSHFFYDSLPLYDFVITTKSFDLLHYRAFIGEEKLLYIPQGYNKALHYPRHSFDQKKKRVVFIGLYEPSRGAALLALLREGIPVALAGKKWKPFVTQNQDYPLSYLGDRLINDAYVKAVSESALSLGLLSKRFPEMHTTRTFEIPACGTALVTEYNEEIGQFFGEGEAIFYKDERDMVERVKYFLANDEALRAVTKRGLDRVRKSAYDYESQLRDVCRTTGIISNNPS